MNEQLIIKADRMAELLQTLHVVFERQGKESDINSEGAVRSYCAFICVEIEERIKEYQQSKSSPMGEK